MQHEKKQKIVALSFFELLPLPLIAEISEYLDDADWFCCVLVSKTWKKIFYNTKKRISSAVRLRDDQIEQFTHFPDLRFLDLGDSCIGEKGILTIALLTSLESLILPELVTNQRTLLLHLSTLTNLKEVEFPIALQQPQMESLLAKLPKLKRIFIEFESIDPKDYSSLTHLDHIRLHCEGKHVSSCQYLTFLKQLKVTTENEIPASHFLNFSLLTRLELLNFGNYSSEELESTSLCIDGRVFSTMKNLTHFYLDLPLKQMEIFAHLTKLAELEIRGIWKHDCGMNQLLHDIHKLSNLVYLNLSDGSDLDVEAFQNLSRLPCLKELTIQIIPFKPIFLKTIGMLTQLVYLFVNHVPEITNASLVFLTALTQLRAINLCDNDQLGDGSFDYLSHLTKLTNLGLSHIGPQTLQKLHIFQDLKDLEVHACEHLFDIQLDPLSNLTNLVDLTITDTNINPFALWSLTNLTRLTKLDLSDNESLQGNIAPSLVILRRLRNINLSGTRVSKQAIVDIKQTLRPWKLTAPTNLREDNTSEQ